MSSHSPVFVAPHYDDVALSCGGAVAVAARSCSPLIVTVFGGLPGAELSDFARFQHQRWGASDSSILQLRRDEDRCAAQALGDAVRVEWLDFLDAIYRDPRYSSDEELFGRVLAEDRALVEDIAGQMERFDASEYIVPAGIGNHVDHQLVLAAGQVLAARGHQVWAYADVPYALLEQSRVTRNPHRFAEQRVVSLDADAFERKCAAIECYASQIPVIFRDFTDPRAALDRYARTVGSGARAEVQWRVLPEQRP